MMDASTVWFASLILKLTILGKGMWIVDRSLLKSNPRWRVGLWRAGLVAAGVVVVAAFAPPLLRWEIVRTEPATPSREVVSAVETRSENGISGIEHDFEPMVEEGAEQLTVAGPLPEVDAFVPLPVSDASAPSSPPPRSFLESFPSLTWAQVTVVVWVLGASVGLGRMAIGVLRVRRIVARSEPASGETLAIAARLANGLGVGLPPVRTSAEVASPVLYGPVRPTILLPSRMESSSKAELDAALAHELAHVAGRDSWWDLGLRIVSCLGWPHPLVWFAAAAHRQACDRVSDLVAAELLGDRAMYGRSLASIALQVAQAPPGAGLAMARRADVVERVRLIASDVRAAALGSRGWAGMTIVSAAAVALGGVAVALTTRTIVAAPPEPAASLEVTVLDAENDRPIPDAEVRLRLRADGYGEENRIDETRTTDEQGVAAFSYPDWKGAAIDVTIRRKGFVSYYVDIDRQPRESFPKARTIRLSKGEPIGGILVDDQGKPFAGAKFVVRGRATDTVSQFGVFDLAEGTTDENGRWSIDAAPKSLEGVRFSPELPGYHHYAFDVRAGLDERYVVERGRSIAGTVSAADGKPVVEARLSVSYENEGGGVPLAKSDAEGRYAIHGLQRRPVHLTAAADGFAPQRIKVVPDAAGADETADFVLEPGRTLKIRFLDAKGKPLAAGYASTQTWGGVGLTEWRGYADAKGEVVWNSAPEGPVEMYVGAPGRMGMENVSMTAGETFNEVRLVEEYSVSGTVVDDATGESIPEFTATLRQQLDRGPGDPVWFDDNPSVGLDGRFELTRNRPALAISVKIEAKGYEAWTSDAMRSTGVQPPIAVRLKKELPSVETKERTIAGIVTDADGKPVADAQVMLGMDSERQMLLQRRGIRYDGFGETSDADGRFEVAYPEIPDEGGRLSVQHDSGYAEAPLVDVRAAGSIRLQPWARLEVDLRRGSEPAPFRRVSFMKDLDPYNGVPFNAGTGSGMTDANGRAVLERVPPGAGRVYVNLMQWEPRGGGRGYPERSERVTLAPGETRRLQLGGTGRAIVGRIELPPDPPMPHDWETNEAGTIEVPDEPRSKLDRRMFRFLVEKDGSFRVDDVPAGTYKIDLALFGKSNERSSLRGTAIGKLAFGPFEHRDDERAPHDLGVLRAEWNERLGAGDVAPAFVAKTAEGGTTTSADYRGKTLVLNFWDSRDAASAAQMNDLARLRKRFAGDERVAIVSVATDVVFESAVDLAKSNGWDWTIVSGHLDGILGKTFDLYATPDCLVVRADGRIAYRGSDSAAIEASLDQALNDMPADGDGASAASSFVPIDDSAFQPSGDVAVIAVFGETYSKDGTQVPDGSSSGIFLYGDDGALRRRIESSSIPQTNTRSGLIAVDRPRGLAYIQDEYGRLVAFDRQGRRLHSLNVPMLQAVAVDESNGDIWCSCSWNRDGWTLVFDAEGHLARGFAIFGRELAYASAADAFWFGGSSAKLVDRTGRTLAEQALSNETAYLRYLTVDAEGGCWALEQASGRTDPFVSVLRRFSKGSVQDIAEFIYEREGEHGTIPRWIEAVGDEVWVCTEQLRGSEESDTRTNRVRRYSSAGEVLGDLSLNVRVASATRGMAWGLTDGELLTIDENGKVAASYPNQNPLPDKLYRQTWLESFGAP